MSFFTIKRLQLTTALLNKVQINNSHILLAKTDQQRWKSLSCLAPSNNCRPFHNRKLVLCESVLPSPAMEWCEIYFSISSRFHVFHIVHTYLKLSQIVHTYSHSPADNRLPTDCYTQFVSSYRLLQTVCVFHSTWSCGSMIIGCWIVLHLIMLLFVIVCCLLIVSGVGMHFVRDSKRGCLWVAPGKALIHTFAVPVHQWNLPVHVLVCITPIDAAAVASPPAIGACRAGTQGRNV